jgi:3alpha(or 20beta)-hydroxysteroid dehydrogenase
MSRRLEGKTVMVTGATGGLGLAQSILAAAEGAKSVILADLPDAPFEEVSERVRSAGAEPVRLQLDVTHETQWARAMTEVARRCSRLDGLVNNAGVSRQRTFDACTLEDWHLMVGVNQTGVFLGMKYGARLLRDSGGGSIVNIASAAGLAGYFSAPYTATKWAVRGMSKTAAMEYADWKVRVNCVCPGFIWTPLTRKIENRVAGFTEIIPQERIGEPEEVAHAVVYFLSPESSFVTGSEIVVDGGMSAGGAYRMMGKRLGVY